MHEKAIKLGGGYKAPWFEPGLGSYLYVSCTGGESWSATKTMGGGECVASTSGKEYICLWEEQRNGIHTSAQQYSIIV